MMGWCNGSLEHPYVATDCGSVWSNKLPVEKALRVLNQLVTQLCRAVALAHVPDFGTKNWRIKVHSFLKQSHHDRLYLRAGVVQMNEEAPKKILVVCAVKVSVAAIRIGVA
mmetsp:Transcript_26857/g.66491  ORF Transcript_26857/g.66491 Transcript_26857/m.66491 type:complete len:111 (+) Transcript_26857:220-552(+)